MLRSRWSADTGPISVDPVAPDQFAAYLAEHGLAGIALRYHAGQLSALFGRNGITAVHHAYMEAAYSTHQARKTLERIASLFSQEGFDWLLLKGLALSVQLYGEADIRSARDLDVLLDPRDVPRATRMLLTQGFKAIRAGTEGRAASLHDLRSQSHEVSLLSPDGVLVEVHSRSDFSPGLSFVPRMVPLAERATVLIDGIQITCLAGRAQVRQVARHAYRSMWLRWKWLYDCVELASAHRDLVGDPAMNDYSVRASLALAEQLMSLPAGRLAFDEGRNRSDLYSCRHVLQLRDSKIRKEARQRQGVATTEWDWGGVTADLGRIGFQMRAHGALGKRLKYLRWRAMRSLGHDATI